MSETIPLAPVEGIHYIKLIDVKTKKNYALTIANNKILLAEISTDDTGTTTLVPVKQMSGTTDRIISSDGSFSIILKEDDVNG